MAIGYIKKKVVEGVETLVPETTAGPSAGTVRKLSFDCNIDYAVPITADETGEGYIGVSGNCKLSFNPKYNIGTVADPEYIGVLKADCFCGKGTNTEIADCVEIGEVCQNLNYKVPFTCNCEVLTACSQNLLFNPNTGALTTNCICASNEIEAMCEIRAGEYCSRTANKGITAATTAEDDTVNHNGDVIYKGCDGELATSSCKDFKFNPSTGTLTVDHVCSCDVTNEINNSKLCDSGQFCICYCSSAKAQDYGAVEMHGYCCNLTSSELSEGCASLAWDGFHVSCVPICQSDGSYVDYSCAIIGCGYNIWESQNPSICAPNCVRAFRCATFGRIIDSVRELDGSCFRCGAWTTLCDIYKYEIISMDCSDGHECCVQVCVNPYKFSVQAYCGDDNYCSCLCVNQNCIIGSVSASYNGAFRLDGLTGNLQVCNSGTSNCWASVLTECDAGSTCALKNKECSSHCLMYEYNNELNSYGASVLWLNYRGGANTVYVGDGSGAGYYGSLYSAVLRADNYTVSPEYIASANNGGSWSGAAAVFRHDASLPLGDIWYPLLGQCVCNGSYQFQLGWYGCRADSWWIRETKAGNYHWEFKANDGSFQSGMICTQTICFY